MELLGSCQKEWRQTKKRIFQQLISSSPTILCGPSCHYPCCLPHYLSPHLEEVRLSGQRSCLQCRRHRFDPGLRSSPGEGDDKPLEDSCWTTWRATVHGVIKSQTRLSTNEMQEDLETSGCSTKLWGLVVSCRAGLSAAERWSSDPSESPSLDINRQARGRVRDADHFFWPLGQCYPG